ncbi:DUF4345 domain-containing protein [Rudanella paleaurantiibacter]|uniref:DUF4345 domain-containing protein n=1 Tax=Rudanella paleaurantiibacter TaxID=2614655 RepID=A0A7J5U412_9BACT|nr:DUF4345 domain-containing protein [Rudanella paleaurantiibacter]KAB7732584.1 DUF4345 domain-containing protein [Rudanella paleaurantiibacter]
MITFLSTARSAHYTQRPILLIGTRLLIGLTAFGIASVACMAFANPQDVMSLVGVHLPNPDAYSSIRGVYGGAGLTIALWLVYLAARQPRQGLVFVAILCGLYALSRLITQLTEGPLGDFGYQWMLIEGTLCGLALLLLALTRRHV